MVLTKEQSGQYYRVLTPFLSFLVGWFEEQGMSMIERGHVYVEYELECTLLDAVFGEGGHLEAVDAYVDASRDKLSGEELDIALDWRHAVGAEFDVVRRGEDVFFLTGSYAIAVRGITHELDDRLLDLPTRTFTYLVPFQGQITYLTVVRPLGTRLSLREGVTLFARLDEATRTGHLLRAADELVDAREAIIEEAPRSSAPCGLSGTLATTRSRALDGLSWDRRQAEIARRERRKVDHDKVIRSLDASCLPGEPTRAYRDFISRQSLSTLASYARAHDVYEPLTKDAYVDLVADIYAPRLPKVIDDLRNLGIRFLREVHDLIAHGGERRWAKDEVEFVDDLPGIVFPLVARFDDGDEYVVVVSDEVSAALVDFDWEAEFARAERLEEALAFLDVATDYRGLILRDEAKDELARRFGDVDAVDIEDAVERRSTYGFIHTVPVVHDSRGYYAASDLVTEGDKIRVGDARAILSRRGRQPPTWPTPEQVAEGRLNKAWESYEEGRRLAAFFDRLAPKTYDEYCFGSDSVVLVVRMMKHTPGAHRWLDQVLTGFADPGPLRDAAAPMLQALYNTLPNRYCNGARPQERWDTYVVPERRWERDAAKGRPKKRPTKKGRR